MAGASYHPSPALTARATKTERMTSKNTEQITNLSIGRKRGPEVKTLAEARAIVEALTQDSVVRAARRAVIAKLIAKLVADRPPYNAEELMATPFSIRSGNVIVTSPPVNRNPHNVYCPLCRRRSTVRLISESHQGKATYSCAYSGCRGLEFEL
jgi:hypothetical protein